MGKYVVLRKPFVDFLLVRFAFPPLILPPLTSFLLLLSPIAILELKSSPMGLEFKLTPQLKKSTHPPGPISPTSTIILIPQPWDPR